jgi:phage shock protein A
MSLINTVSRTLKGLLNDAADSMQDASRDARQVVRELDESIGRAERSLIEIQAQVATQQSKCDAAAERAKKYEDGAKHALESGDEALAREALTAQAGAEAERDALARELVTLEPSVAQLKTQIDDMHHRHNDLSARSNILQAKQQIAQAKDVAATALGGIGSKNLSEDFRQLEDKVTLSNARSDARLDSADARNGKALDDKLALLNSGPSVDERLAALKKQLPAAAH